MLWSYTCRWHCIRWVQGLWTADNVHMGKLACDCWTCSCKCLFLPQQVPCGEATLRLLTYSSKCFLPGIIELVHANVLFLPQQFPCGEVTLRLLTYSSKCFLSCNCWTCSCKCFVSSSAISVWWSYALIVNVFIQMCSFLWLLNLFMQMFCFFPNNFRVVKLRSDC